MDESKKAAKAFVDEYFPIKEPNPKPHDVLGDLFFPPTSKKEFSTKQGYKDQSLSVERTTTGNCVPAMAVYDRCSFYKFTLSIECAPYNCKMNSDGAITDKSHHTTQKESNGIEYCKVSEPCLMSSSVDYGCRDDYPYNPDNRYPGPPSYIEKNDNKNGSEYKTPENLGAEWWQGSLYY